MSNPYRKPTKFKTKIYILVSLLLLLTVSLLLIVFSNQQLPVQNQTQQAFMGLIPASKEDLAQIQDAFLPYYGESEIPEMVDLSKDMPPPGHQGEQSSCVGWALAYGIKSFQEKIESPFNSYQTASGELDHEKIFSPAFVYNQINQGQDHGARIIDGLNLLKQTGAISWQSMPYAPHGYREQPQANQLKQALHYRIESWRDLDLSQPELEIKSYLQKGYPVLVGLKVDLGFKYLQGPQVWQSYTGPHLGLHALSIVGYDDQKQAFKLYNSWGSNWGDRGYGWLAYSFAKESIQEAYITKDEIHSQPSPAENIDESPVPAVQEEIVFHITKITHRIPGSEIQDAPLPLQEFDRVMKIEGQVEIPEEYTGRSIQILVKFYKTNSLNEKVAIIQNTQKSSSFTLANGDLVALTRHLDFSNVDHQYQWAAYIPYDLINPSLGSFDILIEPILFIDDFGIASGNDYAFTLIRE